MFFKLLARYWFWWQLVSIQNSIEKAFKNWFFQLLARSWFWWQLVSIQFQFQKIFKNCSSFWHDLGFGGSFFLQKNCKKIQKGYLLQTQPYPSWTLYLEPPFCIRFGLFYLIRMRQDERRDMMCWVFMTFNICKYNSTKKTKHIKNDTSSKCSHTLGEPYT